MEAQWRYEETLFYIDGLNRVIDRWKREGCGGLGTTAQLRPPRKVKLKAHATC